MNENIPSPEEMPEDLGWDTMVELTGEPEEAVEKEHEHLSELACILDEYEREFRVLMFIWLEKGRPTKAAAKTKARWMRALLEGPDKNGTVHDYAEKEDSE